MNILFEVFPPVILKVCWLEVCFSVGIYKSEWFDKTEESSDGSGHRGETVLMIPQENTGFNRRIGRGKSVIEDLKNQVRLSFYRF